MGVRVHYVGRKQRFRSLEQNINATSSSYPIHNGFFGTKGSSYGVREIHSRNHEKTEKISLIKLQEVEYSIYTLLMVE